MRTADRDEGEAEPRIEKPVGVTAIRRGFVISSRRLREEDESAAPFLEKACLMRADAAVIAGAREGLS